MKLSEICAKVGIKGVTSDAEVMGVSEKSSEIKAGFIFVAIKGTRVDGRDFVSDAVARGAIGVVAESAVSTEVPVFVVENARVILAQMADALYPSDSLKKVAITGTNGKTSTVYYVAQIMNALRVCTASMGTIGIESPVYKKEGAMTTPDIVTVHQNLHALQQAGVQVVAMEASSQGLHQERLAGVNFEVAGFSNLTQDHLDYHGSMQAYFAAKKRVFLERMVVGGTVVLNADIAEFDELKGVCEAKGLRVLSYGENGVELKLISRTAMPNGQKIELEILGNRYETQVNIVGDFQISNILCAMGLCIGLGVPSEKIMGVIKDLTAPAGRLECVGTLPNSAAVYVDYAHTPDALERVLKTMRAHTKNKLVCVFGCGGDRDKSKRPLMGAIVQKYADVAYLTDDNPRGEEAAIIRAEIKAAVPHAIEIGDRHIAIDEAVRGLKEGDVLVIAGKGHEAGQKIGQTVYAFDDKVEAKLALLKQEKTPLWTYDELKVCITGNVPEGVFGHGISIDTRTLKLGDMFVAIRGDHLDGHAYVFNAVSKGAAICLVDHLVADVPASKQIVVEDVQVAFEQMGAFARTRSEATFIGITGSSGKTTTKEMLKLALSDQGKTHATAGNLNGKIGVPLTMCLAQRDAQYVIVEMGMDHLGDLTNLSKMVRPDVTIITMIGSAHLAYFKGESEIALAKSEIFIGQEKQGTAVLNADSPFYDFLRNEATKHGIRFITSFGKNETADFKLLFVYPEGNNSRILADWHGSKIEYTIGFLGHHFAMNSLAVLSAVDAVGASVMQATKSLSKASAVAGRGACEKVTLPSGKSYFLIDDSYNANPSSMAASLQTLGMHSEGPRIALLGDMLELGPNEVQLHTNLAQNLLDNKVLKVYAVGTLMKHLFDVLPENMKGVWKQTPQEIAKIVLDELPEGAVLLVKSSRSTWLLKIIPTLKGV